MMRNKTIIEIIENDDIPIIPENQSPTPQAPPTPPPQLSPLLVSLADLPKLKERATSLEFRKEFFGDSMDNNFNLNDAPVLFAGGSLPSSPVASPNEKKKKKLGGMKKSSSRDDLRIPTITNASTAKAMMYKIRLPKRYMSFSRETNTTTRDDHKNSTRKNNTNDYDEEFGNTRKKCQSKNISGNASCNDQNCRRVISSKSFLRAASSSSNDLMIPSCSIDDQHHKNAWSQERINSSSNSAVPKDIHNYSIHCNKKDPIPTNVPSNNQNWPFLDGEENNEGGNFGASPRSYFLHKILKYILLIHPSSISGLTLLIESEKNLEKKMTR